MEKGKTKKICLSLFVVLILCGFTASYVLRNEFSVHGNVIRKIKIGGRNVRAEVVSSEEKMHKGLGERNGLCSDCGMLFVFHAVGRQSFWMKDMKFPLDIVWIRQGRIIYMERNISPTDQRIFFPEAGADMVLELNGGFCEKYGLKEGDLLEI